MKKYLTLLALTAMLGSLLSSTAFASHFRFAQITWRRVSGAPDPRTVEFTIKEAWRSTAVAPGDLNFSTGDGGFLGTTGFSTVGTFTDLAGEGYTVIQKIVTHVYASDGPFTVTANNCCRISSLINAGDQSETITAIVDLRNGNQGSPVGSVPIILQMTQGIVNIVPLAIPDPDGDPVTCRMATFAESSIPTVATAGGFPLTVSSNCVLNWNTAGTVVGQKYAVQVIAEENHAGNVAKVPLDFIIEITGTNVNQPPTCSGTNGTIVVPVGTPFAGSITGTDPEGANLIVNHLGLPPGATLTPSNGSVNPSPVTATVNWTPGPADAGSAYSITLLFTDPSGFQSSCTFGVSVPLVTNHCPVANPLSVTVNSGSSTNFLLPGSDQDGNPLQFGFVQAPAQGAAVIVTATGAATYAPNSNACGSDSFTYSVSDGTCSATNTVSITIVDVTPPILNCPTNITQANDPGQCSAVVNFTVTATDNCSTGTGSGVLYGCDQVGFPSPFGASTLFTINLTTGAGTPVGPLPSGSTEIEFNNATGRAFAQFKDGSFGGQEFDINTGAGIGGAVADGASFTGLEWVGTNLYGTTITSGGGSAPSTLQTLDPDTGASTVVGPTGLGPIPGLAYDSTTGTMYGITGGQSNANLVAINLITGAATVIGNTGFQAGSLEFGPDGNLYGGSTGTNGGNLYRIDPSTGASTLIGPTGFPSVTGLALVIPTNGGSGVTVVCTPPSGSVFPAGTTTVTCTATDAVGNTNTCTFTVTVNDTEPPLVACREASNPSGKKIPVAGKNPRSGQNPDGFYQLLTKDNCDSNPTIYILDPVSGFVAGPFANGDIVKITQVPGGTPGQQPMAGVVVAHVFLNGDALLYAVDADGNVGTTVSCFVPPPPK